jgi:glycosyltransferase involved in cell wall biosynthesis
MNNKREKILILFNGEHIAYSPTVIQLYDELQKKYDVTVTAEYPHSFNNQKLANRNVLYHRFYHVKGRYFYWILFQFISLFNYEAKLFKKNQLNYKEYFFKFRFIKKIIHQHEYKTIISVDILNAVFCSILRLKTDFLSLELTIDERHLHLIDFSYIDCVLIQSTERYQYLFKDKEIKTFFVQNAPIYKYVTKETRNGLVYGGSAYDELGFYHCLDYVNIYKNERLTVQGAIMSKDIARVESEYKHLLDEKRLILNRKYLENDEVVESLSNYEIGFCFYNFNVPVIRDNYFNYASAPSGKMFKYIAAGVPVVASNIIGFKFVTEFQCGILIDDLSPKEIHKAISKIREDYSFYVENANRAAKFYSFDKAVEPYLEVIAKR